MSKSKPRKPATGKGKKGAYPNTDERYKKFALELFKNNFNQKQAAIKVGYSKRSAEMEGSRLMRNDKVRKELTKLAVKVEEKGLVEAEEIILELRKVGIDTNITDFLDFSGSGVIIKDSGKIDKEKIGAIAEVSERRDKLGKIMITLKQHDKLKALELLGRYKNLFEKEDKGDTPKIIIEVHKYGL